MIKLVNVVRGAFIATLLAASGYASAATVNLGDTFLINAGRDTINGIQPGNEVSLELGVGTYRVDHVQEEPFAWNAWGRTRGCSDGVCTQGWLNEYLISVVGDSTVIGGSFKVRDGVRYDSPEAAFAAANPYTFSILSGVATVTFKIDDNPLTDNRGGLTLSVSEVPLPAAAWLFLSALGGMAGIKRMKRSRSASFSA